MKAVLVAMIVFLLNGTLYAEHIPLRADSVSALSADSSLEKRARRHEITRLAVGIPVAYVGTGTAFVSAGILIVEGILAMFFGPGDMDFMSPVLIGVAGLGATGVGAYILGHPTKTEQAWEKADLEHRKRRMKVSLHLQPDLQGAQIRFGF